MTTYLAIAAMSRNRVIGREGKIPWHLPEDFRWFKHKTIGGTLVMGRKTYESIGQPLPGRRTVLLSKHGAQVPGLATYPNVETMAAAEAQTPKVWVCGGAEVYRQLLPRCSLLYLTRVARECEGDVFFPPFEDVFSLHDVIHRTAEFQVERWISTRVPHAKPDLAREAWPF
jgi:dihydrofolate reductase